MYGLFNLFLVALSSFTRKSVILHDESVCPPPEQISPCTCFKNQANLQRVTALCNGFTEAGDLREIFTKNPNWNLQDVHIDNAVMAYLPAAMLEHAVFQSLNVSSTTLVNLFDYTPVTTPELNLYLYDLKILRGFQWSSIANSTLLEFGAWNTDIKNFGQDFKDHMPINVERLWFDNTQTSRITNNAFVKLQKLSILTLIRGSLKVISRDMFPRPWKVTYLDFSFNKIDNLPENLFDDMPNLGIFLFQGNLLTTLSEKVFVKNSLLYNFSGNPINCNCDIKWITIPGKIIPMLFKGECFEPESLKGKELGSFKQSDFSFCT